MIVVPGGCQLMLFLLAAPQLPPAADPARVWLLNAAGLERSRTLLAAGDESLRSALDQLVAQAESALSRGPWSVMDKELTPPSGDKHDYLSIGPYWWPNPATPDGLPYVRRDGEVNPERSESRTDATSLGRMTSAVSGLGLAWHFTGNPAYAERAALLLRTWFLDEATRMNPNLNYGQAIPGRTEGRGIGIIDTGGWVGMLDSVGLLAGSPSWTEADQSGLEQWFGEYLDWLLTSKHGRDEDRAGNNHGTYYDLQVVRYALFAGRREVAEQVLGKVLSRRIAKQVEPDGRQPHELARTKSWSYSVMNLRGFVNLATMADGLGLDLWRSTTEDGRGIRVAIDYLAPYADAARRWPHQEIGGEPKPTALAELLRRAAAAYGEPAYETLLELIPAEALAASRWRLSWPE